MRGDDRQPDSMFSYVSAEHRVPSDHPLRAIRALVEGVTLCGKRIVGYPSRDPQPALCQHCVLARLKSM